MFRRILRMQIAATVALALAAQLAAAEKSNHDRLVDEAIRWLPADTETLTVSRAFKVERMAKEGIPSLGVPELQRAFFVGDLTTPVGETARIVDLDPIVGQTVATAVEGQRNFDGVSSFGGLRSESCKVLFFEKDLGNAWDKLEASLRAKAKNVRQLAMQEVFEFPSTIQMEPWYKPKEWQGLFVTRVAPEVVLIASSDSMLEGVLQRRKTTLPRVALPATLPEWKHVDPKSTIWSIRHIPISMPRTFFEGATIAWHAKKVEIAYLGTNRASEKATRYVWTPSKLMKLRSPDLSPEVALAELEKMDPRTSIRTEQECVLVTLQLPDRTSKLNDIEAARQFYGFFSALINLHRLRGEDGTFFGGRQYIPDELRP